MDRRDRLYHFYRRNPSAASRYLFKGQRNCVVWLQRKAKNEYFHRLLHYSSIPSAIYPVWVQWNARRMAPKSCPAHYPCSCMISTWGNERVSPKACLYTPISAVRLSIIKSYTLHQKGYSYWIHHCQKLCPSLIITRMTLRKNYHRNAVMGTLSPRAICT